MIELKHEIYGRVKVSQEALATDQPFVKAVLMNPRPNLPTTIMVGKVALSDHGGYTPKKRTKSTTVEQYLPLVTKCVAQMSRSTDEWEELYAEATLGLVEAASRYNYDNGNGFAAFAQPYIMGYIKNHQNPDRTGYKHLHDDIGWYSNVLTTSKTSVELDGVVEGLYNAADTMTKKQWQVMKLIYIEGYTEEGAANKMGSTRDAVKSLKDKGIKHLRDFMGVAKKLH